MDQGAPPLISLHTDARKERNSPFSSIEDALAAFARGEILVVMDDPARENEGDFVVAAEWATPDIVNFMITHGRGLLCLALRPEVADALELPLMAPSPAAAGAESVGHTAFTVSIDLKEPASTGISALDRARCIRRAVARDATPDEFRRPGHVFPLRAREGGVLERAGHTEAAVDLARLAGVTEAGVICEIMKADGTMARRADLVQVAAEHGLHMITIADLVAYRRRTEPLVRKLSEGRIPTDSGEFTAVCFSSELDDAEHVAMLYGNPIGHDEVLVRVHSECLTGDVFGSRRCDCGDQLRRSMEVIAAHGRGAIVYVRGHEGRGIGLAHKLEAYNLQDAGADTVEANQRLGLPVDARSYLTAANIIRALEIGSVRLLSNNPAKRVGLEEGGIHVVELVPLEILPNPESLSYLRTKRDKLDHSLLSLERFELMA
jgi:3,4-dihydroxy 2-butanone 4-phosphate synthase/GTP cyclohydrolase II